MHDHPATRSPDLLVGFDTGDDAGVFRLSEDRALVQTVDFFTPVVDGPRDWGRIAAANALSDVYAMGGTPLTALQLLGWPRDELAFDLAGEVLAGGADVMAEAGCTIVGGHSIDDPEPKYGFAVTGTVDPRTVVTNAGARPGDRIVLTKPLGTGIIATAIKRGLCPPDVAAAAIETMAALNRVASEAMISAGASAATDVTGFGFLGHVLELASASGVSVEIQSGSLPLLPGVHDLLAAGCYPGGSERNLEAVSARVTGGDDTTVRILADAQTSGGLLIATAPDSVSALLDVLTARGVMAADVGRVVAGAGAAVVIR